MAYFLLKPHDVALFRFLLEAYEHLGYFTVLEPKTALIKFVCPFELRKRACAALSEIALSLELQKLDLPWQLSLSKIS